MKLSEAQLIARKYQNKLKEFCLYRELLDYYCDIAGSVIREKPEVKDIEIVCIPDLNRYLQFVHCVEELEKIKGEATGKHTQRLLPEGINLDLFMVESRNFGLQKMIRTGPAEFSKRMMWEVKEKGFYVKDGFLWKNSGEMAPVREEKDFFEITGIKWVDPKERN